jgi:hypothetical protein
MGKTNDSDLKSNWYELTHRDVTRKQFLMILSGGLIAILGFGNFISFFESATKKKTVKQVADDTSPSGYGTRKFGQ